MAYKCSLYAPTGELIGHGECDLRGPEEAVAEVPKGRIGAVPGTAGHTLILSDGRSLPVAVRAVHAIPADDTHPAREQYELQIITEGRKKESRERRGIAGAVRSLFGRG